MIKQNLWEKAIQELEPADRDKIPAQDRHAAALETVLSSARSKQVECQRKHWKYRKRDGSEVELRQVFGRVVQRLAKFKAIGDGVVVIDPVHLAIPWAAISLALQLAVSDSESYQTVFEGIETFSALVPRYLLFERLYLHPHFPLQENLEQALVKLYATALKYLIKAQEYYATTTVKRLAKSLMLAYAKFDEWMREIKEQQRIADELARLIDAQVNRLSDEKLDVIARDQDVLLTALKDFQAPIQLIQDGLADLAGTLTQQERDAQTKRVLAWLSPISSVAVHKQRLDARQPGSGQWVFDREDYIKWRVSNKSAVLWLHGLPGTGKSTLMSTIIDNLQTDHAHAPGSLVAYVFCSRNRSDARWQEPGMLVRSLIAQLAHPGPSGALRGDVIRAYDNLVQKEGDAAAAEGAGLLWNDATQLLLQLLDQGTTTICIDALDECDEESRAGFLALIDHLLTRADGGNVKILISSRPSLNIAHRFPSWACYSIDAGQNAGDINAYARDRAARCLEEMRYRVDSISSNLEEDLTRHLIDGAQGMFLWVGLRAKMLIRQSSHAIFEGDLLRPSGDIPEPLVGLFDDIYARVLGSGSLTCRTALTTFQWLLCAQATVSAEDVVQALSVYFQRDCRGSGEQSTKITVARLLDSCQDLVTVDEDTNELRFIHTAVRDFLEHKDSSQPPKSHAVVAELCLATVQTLALAAPINPPQARNSFHSYVVLYWASHVAEAGHNHRTDHIENALQDLCQERSWFGAWLHQIAPASSLVLEWNDPHKDKIMQALSSPATSFFTACAFGFTEVVDYCIKANRDIIHKTNESGATGLHLAAEYGHQAVAEALCKAGADVHSVDNDGETALIRAAARGHKPLVVLFVGAGASQNTHGRRYGTALYGAALHGHLDVVQVLVKYGANLMAAEGRFGTALHAACVRGHVRVVKYLLGAGADVNAAGGGENKKRVEDNVHEPAAATSALRAIEVLLEKKRIEEEDENKVTPAWEEEEKLQLLLDHKVDLNILRSGFGPPLHIAARAGHVAVVEALLNYPGVQVNLLGGEYGSALQAAVMGGRTTIVQRLLDAGADVNVQAGRFGTALTGACRLGNTALAESLLRAGAAVNIQAGVYGTALQAACRSGSHFLVKGLLDDGADVNLTGGTYFTPLQAAARDGYEEIVQLLIQRGAIVNLKGGVLGSALEAAAVGGHRRVVEMLWKAKAKTRTALQISCLRGHRSVVQYLLDQGCDLNEDPDMYETAIQAALAGQHHSLVDWLLGLGADISDTWGRLGTVLQLAAWTGRTDLVRRCVGQGVDHWEENYSLDMDALKHLGCKLPSSIESRFAFPIVFAAAGGHSQIVKILLDAPKLIPVRRRLFPDDDVTAWSTTERGLDGALRAALDADHAEIASLLLRNDIRLDWLTVQCACTKSDPDFVTSLLEKCLPVDRHRHIVRGLSAAAAHCRVDLVEVLLPRVLESKEFTPGDLATALRNAVSKGHSEIVHRLLASGAQPMSESSTEGHLLQLPPLTEAVLPAAVASGHRGLVQMFLDRNTKLDVVDDSDGTALQAAAYSGAEDIVDDLLDHGADPNVEGGTFGTAVQAAAAAGHEAVVKRLLVGGADVRCQGGRPEEWEVEDTHFEWKVKGLKDVQKEYERLTLEFELFAKKAPSRSQNGLHGTALQAATVGGNVRIVAMLIEAGSDVNDIDRLGQTPLHRAAYHGHLDVAVLLVSKGAKAEAIDCCCRTPMLLAVIAGQRATFAYLFALENQRRVDGPQRALHLAAKHGHIGIIEYLLGMDIDLEDADAEGQTALLIAADHGQYSMIHFLLGKGSDICSHNNEQQTALHLAARSGHDDVVRLLLASGADSLAVDRQGQPALHAAVMAGHRQVVYLFAEHPSLPLGLRDRSGRTALHLAADKDDKGMVALLLGKGADVNAEDSGGKTALALCLAKNIKELLIAHGATSPQVPQKSDTNGRIEEFEDEYTDSDLESSSGCESGQEETPNSRPERKARSVSSGRGSTSGRRLGRNDRTSGPSRRGTFTGGSDTYRRDKHYGRRSIRRDSRDRSGAGRHLHSRPYDGWPNRRLLHDGPYGEDKGGGGGGKCIDADDNSDTKDMITLMVECVLVLLVALMVVVVVAVLAMLAMTAMMMGMAMWTMLSLVVIKWARIFWP